MDAHHHPKRHRKGICHRKHVVIWRFEINTVNGNWLVTNKACNNASDFALNGTNAWFYVK